MTAPISEEVQSALDEGANDTVEAIVRDAQTSLRAFAADLKDPAKLKSPRIEQHLDEVEMDLSKLREKLVEARRAAR